MKKILSLLLVLLFLAPLRVNMEQPGERYVEAFKTMDKEELLLCYKALRDEFISRRIDPVMELMTFKKKDLYVGEYIVGVHIDAGEYSVLANRVSYLTVFRDGKIVFGSSVDDKNIIGRIILEVGDVIQISVNPLIFDPNASFSK